MPREIIRPSSCQQKGSCGRLVLNLHFTHNRMVMSVNALRQLRRLSRGYGKVRAVIKPDGHSESFSAGATFLPVDSSNATDWVRCTLCPLCPLGHALSSHSSFILLGWSACLWATGLNGWSPLCCAARPTPSKSAPGFASTDSHCPFPGPAFCF